MLKTNENNMKKAKKSTQVDPKVIIKRVTFLPKGADNHVCPLAAKTTTEALVCFLWRRR